MRRGAKAEEASFLPVKGHSLSAVKEETSFLTSWPAPLSELLPRSGAGLDPTAGSLAVGKKGAAQQGAPAGESAGGGGGDAWLERGARAHALGRSRRPRRPQNPRLPYRAGLKGGKPCARGGSTPLRVVIHLHHRRIPNFACEIEETCEVTR